MPYGVTETLSNLTGDLACWRPCLGTARIGQSQQVKRADKPHIAKRVEHECERNAPPVDQDAGNHRPCCTRGIEDHGIDADGRGEVFALDQMRHQWQVALVD